MKALLTLLLSLLCLTASASPGQPYFVRSLSTASQPPNLTNVPGLYSWWVSSDYPTNVQVTNWVARISGVQLTNTAALAPTNSATGMGFAGNTWYKLDIPSEAAGVNGNTNVWMVIMQPYTPAADFGGLLVFDNTTVYTGGRGIFLMLANNYYWSSTGNYTFGSFSPGTIFDFIFEAGRIGLGTNTYYTNGVVCATLNDDAARRWSIVGKNPGSSSFFKGKILEIAHWTNQLSTLNISNIHYYVTNTYKTISP